MKIRKAIKCPVPAIYVGTISDKIFELLKEKGMSQKEFAQRTGIAESSISDWKKKEQIR